jgi:hypothetical protein
MPRLSKIGAAALAAFGWTSGDAAVTASYLQVAGGGGGGTGQSSSSIGGGGGGGAGGYLTGSTTLNPTLSYTVVVGAGGAGGIANTSNSVTGNNSQFGTLTASVGGGSGGNYQGNSAGIGGSGGGGNYLATSGAAGTSGQGNAGGNAYQPGAYYGNGGGGGAGAVGGSAASNTVAPGGVGLTNSITGTSTYYAGGGGGGSGQTAGGSAAGGLGGGGAGGFGTTAGTPGTANLGGGGGGGGNIGTGGTPSSNGGNGGSGVVIISYPSPQKFGGGIVTTSGANTIHTFQTSGTLSPLSSLSANYLVVAGGGGGGGRIAGGGGAGGLLTGSGVTIDTNSIYVVTVGSGGNGGTNTGGSGTRGTSGSNSVFLAATSTGGGGGGNYGSNDAGLTGGSGGGGSGNNGAGGSGTSGQGNAGGTGSILGNISEGGGGGGASAAGSDGQASGSGRGNGGAGTASSISGSSVTYAGGGGGGAYFTAAVAGDGGSGGGGAGSIDAGATGGTGTGTPANGTANLGGGGGGNGVNASGAGGNGGSGIVIISYAGSTQLMAGGTVTISGGNVIHTFTSSGYLTPLKLVNNSLRFRLSANAYLNRTPSTAGNQQIWTWSGWVKRGTLATLGTLFSGGTTSGDTTNFNIAFTANDTIALSSNLTSWRVTSAVYRDPAAWYHLVIAVDTTQATADNRIKLYVNGLQVTAFGTNTAITQNSNTGVNSTEAQNLGRRASGSDRYTDSYLTEVQLIDGQALTPNSFGTFNSYGVWQPITYGGSYGTNGFYLPFTNTGALTASYLVVAGGGGTSSGGGEGSGGGGAGGLLTSTTTINPGTSYTVVVGAGGAATSATQANGNSGSNTTAFSLTAIGGGGSGNGSEATYKNGLSGGSGGGGGVGYPAGNGAGGAGTSGQGYAGGSCTGYGSPFLGAGGGGAGAVGANGATAGTGNGGIGIASSISGTSTYYAGGGGGGAVSGTAGAGGSGGGGRGNTDGTAGTAGTANTGGGAGGGSLYLGGYSGGSGVVIVSYTGTPKFTGGTITQSGGNTIHTFTSSGTLNGIGSDYSPNGNNWTANNFSFSSGSTYDSMTDVPTLTSATAANYAVLNPLDTGGTAPTNGNLTFTAGAAERGVRSTIAIPTTGLFYAEFLVGTNQSGAVDIAFGLAASTTNLTATPLGASNVWAIYCSATAQITRNGSTTNAGAGTALVSGDILQLAVDLANNKGWIGKNNTWFNGSTGTDGNPSAGTNATFTFSSPPQLFVLAHGYSSTMNINFGQQPWTYTPPTNYTALNTFNL